MWFFEAVREGAGWPILVLIVWLVSFFFGQHPTEWRVIWAEAGGLLWFYPWPVVVLPVNW